MTNRVYAIVLNYNSFVDTKKCVEFLREQDFEDFNILIIDNNSDESDLTKLKEFCSGLGKVTLLLSRENKGYSAGNNIGLKYATEHGANWSLIINPDVELRDKHYITNMIDAIPDDEDTVVVASNVVLPSGERQNPMREPTFKEIIFPLPKMIASKIFKRKQWYLGKNETGFCEKVSGSCFFIKNSFLAEINYLDENVFLYCEEPILMATVKRLNKKMYYIADYTAFHMHFENKKSDPRKRMKLFLESRKYYITNYSLYSEKEKGIILRKIDKQIKKI